MRKFYVIFLTSLLALSYGANAQSSFSFSCIRDTVIDACATSCITLTARIPNIHASSSTYEVNSVTSAPGGCFRPYVGDSIPGTPTSIDADDQYSENIVLPFTFPFFGTDFSSLHLSGNGFLSFDPTIQEFDFSHWGICDNGGFLGSTGTPLDLPSNLYDPALIMGPYHDLDIIYTTSPNRLIKYDVVGTPPHRKWIASYFKVPLFLTGTCDTLIQNTHQIVLYEGNGVVEVFVKSVQNCPDWNMGRAMIGMQNFNQDQGIMAPGRAASDPSWGAINMNETWRFVPTAGPTLYRSTQLYNLAGTLISTGDTTSLNNTTFEVAFPNVCPVGTTTYVIKTTYAEYNDPNILQTVTDTVNVVAGSIYNAAIDSTNASCANHGIGTVAITILNPGTAQFEYSIDGINFQASNIFNLPAGTYTIYYRVVGSTCILSTTATVLQDGNPVSAVYTPISNVSCFGGTNGSITATAVGGASPYLYSINTGATQPTGVFNNLPAGIDTVHIVDNVGCTKDTIITITEPPVLAITQPTPTDATCSATANGIITPNGATGGTPGYTYSVDGTTFGPGPFTVANGNYNVIVKDANGCTATIPVTVGLTNDLTVQSILDTAICLGSSVVLTTTSNYPAATYTWTGAGLNSTTIQNPTATPTTAGTTIYTVTGSLGGCQNGDQVQVNTDAQVAVNAGPDATISTGGQIQLTATATGATSYMWTSVPAAGGLSSTTILNPVASPTETTIYTLTATNAAGCKGSDDVTISVVSYCIKVRNAFTPNGDGNNDLWKVYEQFDCLKNVTVHIYNRYGSAVFESKDYRNTWDGRYKGKTLPDGTYYAVIEFTLQTGKVQVVKTDLTILR